ncbi:Sensor_kinase_SpoOB-type, alpha-helical domain [Caloranaerobacter azorensis DSM 13643]|uniref:Sensor_kinase_SpoOB-type, alpha-helical domain n=1 Tax=Caloranaerobacter azorensis DSM 13643 TaxID=1121264 RepID=A0A1M5TGB1_9FIRM|nr:Spo0B domain-containing protein [Caloranaerobacter azorensis]SHH49690.1 Sensor_kinase_SpoOB-type, alpha-helical domain [Caloranaerobacter azorensis DSM 13643]
MFKLNNKIGGNKGLTFSILSLLILLIYINLILTNYVFNKFIQILILISIFTFEMLSIYELNKFNVCIGKESCKNVLRIRGEFTRKLKNLSREQRHDWMNVLQVIYGYLQLSKYDMAIKKINDLSQITLSISRVYKLTITPICLLLERKIKEAYNNGIIFIFNVNNFSQVSYRHVDNLTSITKSLEYIIDKILEYNEYNYREINIEIFEYIDKLEVIIKGKFDFKIGNEFLQNIDIRDDCIIYRFDLVGITELNFT